MDSNELERVLLNKCIEHYNAVYREYNEHGDGSVDYGMPPQKMTISLYDAQRSTEHFCKKTLIKRWLYVEGKLSVVDIHQPGEEITVSGMFYNIASGHLFWDLAGRKAFVDMIYGKRYARGYSYDIVQSERGIVFENESVDWVS